LNVEETLISDVLEKESHVFGKNGWKLLRKHEIN